MSKQMLVMVVDAKKIDSVRQEGKKFFLNLEGEEKEILSEDYYQNLPEAGDIWVTDHLGFESCYPPKLFSEFFGYEKLEKNICKYLQSVEETWCAQYVAKGLINYLMENQHVAAQFSEESSANPDPQDQSPV